jgi:hypothetical protein
MTTNIGPCPYFHSEVSPPHVVVCGLEVNKNDYFVVYVVRNDYENASNFQGDDLLRSSLLCFLKNRYDMTDEALEGLDYAEEFLQETEEIYFTVGDKFLEEWDEKKGRYDMRFNFN